MSDTNLEAPGGEVLVYRLGKMEDLMAEQSRNLNSTREKIDALALQFTMMSQKLSDMQSPGKSDMCVRHADAMQAAAKRIDAQDVRLDAHDTALDGIKSKLWMATGALIILNGVFLWFSQHLKPVITQIK